MAGTAWKITSPNGRLVFEVYGSAEHPAPVRYRLTIDESPLVLDSPLGIVHSGSAFTEARLEIAGARSIRDDYELLHGKRRRISTTASETELRLTNGDGAQATLTVRAYDDGVAFRYGFDSGDDEVQIVAEHTGFSLPEGRAWIQPQDVAGLHTPAYEAAYTNGSRTGEATTAPSWNLPALFETPNGWVLLAEAGVGPGHSAIHLGPQPDGGTYVVVPPEPDEARGIGDVWPSCRGAWTSPWRVIVAGDTLGPIVESTLITDLAEPARVEDTDWVRPGRVAWSWWSDHDSPKSLAKLHTFVDFAADMGWEHHLVDANWNIHSDDEIRALVTRAADAGIGTFLWYNSGGPNNEVTEQPRDRMFDPDVRSAEFAKLADWGVAGVKVDFFHSDKQEGLARMWAILEDAVEHRIMVNFHGCTVPRGWRRTWPHVMTWEGVRGAEQYAFAATYPATAVWHNTVLPFTRNVIGAMDYTPVTFSHQLYPRLTTDAHELALAVVYESGLLHLADSADSYRSLPEEVQALLRSVPVVWDETKYLAGQPGESCVLARRNGDDWWIAGICGPEAMSIEGELDFIPGHHYGVLVTDGTGGLETRDVSLSEGEAFSVEMQEAGGFLLHIPGA